MGVPWWYEYITSSVYGKIAGKSIRESGRERMFDEGKVLGRCNGVNGKIECRIGSQV